jgi:hypothetical protein
MTRTEHAYIGLGRKIRMTGLQKCFQRNHTYISVQNINIYLIVSCRNYRRTLISVDSVSAGSVIRGLPRLGKKSLENWRNKGFISLKTCTKQKRAVTWWNPVAQTCPILIFLCPRTHTSPQTCHHSASSVLAVWISCHVLAVFVFRKQQEEWRSQWIPTVG